jgi:hypothetical protein
VKYNYLSYKHRRVGVVSFTVIREIFSVPCVSSVPVVLFRYILPTGYSALFFFCLDWLVLDLLASPRKSPVRPVSCVCLPDFGHCFPFFSFFLFCNKTKSWKRRELLRAATPCV